MTCDIVITRTQGIVYIESLPSIVVDIIIEFIMHSFRLSTGYEPGGRLILSFNGRYRISKPMAFGKYTAITC